MVVKDRMNLDCIILLEGHEITSSEVLHCSLLGSLFTNSIYEESIQFFLPSELNRNPASEIIIKLNHKEDIE